MDATLPSGEQRRAARRGEEAGAPVRYVRLPELGVHDGLKERAVRVEAVGRHGADGLSLDVVSLWPGPVLGVRGIREESLDRPDHLARYLRLLEGRVGLEAVAHLPQAPRDGAGIIADAGYKSEACNKDSGHASGACG